MGATHRQAFPGQIDQVRAARHFVARVLAGCECAETAALLTSEAAANAVEHTDSRHGEFVVEVTVNGRGAAIAVTDQGGAGTPRLLVDGREDGTRGRGVMLIDALAERWGIRPSDGGNTVWFEVA